MIKNLIPYFIIEQFEKQNLSGTFQAASLFVDISGFTKTTEALMRHGQEGAEMLADVMLGVFEPLVESVYVHGGFITGFAGDAFTALFPHGNNHLERALAAALRIQQYMDAHPIQFTSVGDFHFAAKLGLAEGQVNWGILLPDGLSTEPIFKQPSDLKVVNSSRRSGPTATYYFSGSAVDHCAGAEHYANSGDLILTSAVHQALASLLTSEQIEDHFRVTAVTGELPSPQRLRVALADLNQVAAFIEPAILNQKTRGEFRHVLAVFIQLKDVNGVDGLNSFVQAIFELQKQYGGHLNAVDFGDKGCNMLLFWGAPTSFENDIERSLNFVLSLLSKTSITFRAGITYRLMYAGLVGAPLRREYSCYGRGINLAARHMVAAPWGTLWLDEEVSKRAAPLFQLSFEGHFKFKGFADKLPVHRLMRRKQAIEILYRGQMVGRQQELAQLIAFLDPIFDQRFTGLMLIYGDTGIGKSRLIHTLQTSAELTKEDRTLQWFLCQTDQTGSVRHSLNPFRYWLRHYFAIDQHHSHHGSQTEEENKERFEHKLSELIAATSDSLLQQELDRTRSLLGALVDLHWPNSLYEQLEPELRFNNTLDALKTLFKAESLRQPVVILLEDVHWLDSDSVQFIQQLTRNIESYPIAMIATSRPDFPAGTDKTKGLGQAIFGQQVPTQEIGLALLDKQALGLLAQDVLGVPAAPELVDLLLERADGNPFFTEQILLYLRDTEGLSKTEAGFAPAKLSESLLPTDVRALLVARLDRLAQDVKNTVQTASVLGREFEVQLLTQMLRDEELLHKITRAEQAAIWSALSQLRYIFKQALLRDTAYDMQLRAQQRQLHQSAAKTIESLYDADLVPHYIELAYHYGQAQNEPKERHYAYLAGTQAASEYANDEAIHYFSRALALTPEHDQQACYDLLLAREKVYDWLGKREEQQQDLVTLRALADTLNDAQKQAEIGIRQANYARMTSDYPTAISAAQEAAKRATQGQAASLQAEAHHLWGRVLSLQGNYDEAQGQLEEALTLAQTSENRRVEADSLLNLGNTRYYRANYTLAQSYYEKALQIYRAINQPKGEATCLTMLGAVHSTQGEYLATQLCNNQALIIYQNIGYRLGESIILGNMGVNYGNIGDYELASHHQEQAIAISQEIGDREGESYGFSNLALVYYGLGRYETAVGICQQAVAIHQEIGDRYSEGYTLTYLGHALTDLKQYHLAKDAYQNALELRRELGADKALIDDLAGLASVELQQGHLSQALLRVEEILAWINSNGVEGIEYPVKVYLACYQVLHALTDDESAQERAKRILVAAYELLQKQATNIKDEQLREKFLQNVSANREIQVIWQAQDLSIVS